MIGVQAVGSIAGGIVALRWRPRHPLVAGVAASLLMVAHLAVFAAGGPLRLIAGLSYLVGEVISPNDFTDLAEVEARLAGFEQRYHGQRG